MLWPGHAHPHGAASLHVFEVQNSIDFASHDTLYTRETKFTSGTYRAVDGQLHALELAERREDLPHMLLRDVARQLAHVQLGRADVRRAAPIFRCRLCVAAFRSIIRLCWRLCAGLFLC